jgi:hypothetical protein
VIFQRLFFERNLRSTPLFMLSSQPENHQIQIQKHLFVIHPNCAIFFFEREKKRDFDSPFERDFDSPPPL